MARRSLPLGTDSISYRLTLEPIMVPVAGPRALLLQVCHPVVGAGVAQFSDYERDPYTRLSRTLGAMTELMFGPPERSRYVSGMLRRRHTGIAGELHDGTPYRALDPENMRWVWATLLDTLVVVHDRFIRPLSDAERDQIYDEWLLVAAACGVRRRDCPPDYDAFGAYVARVVEQELRPTDTARKVARMLRSPPPPPPIRGVASTAFSILVPGLLPASLRHELGYPWDATREAAFEGVASMCRAAAFITPGRLRRAPSALATRVSGLR